MEPTTHMTPLASARHLRQQLRQLAETRAPATLLASVCTAVDVADRYFTLETPVGLVYVAYNSHGLSAVQCAESSPEFERRFREQFGRGVYLAGELPATMAGELQRELRGQGRARVRFDLRGLSEFERAVLLKALEIPRGEVRPYAWVAREIGKPRAVRAVGTALGNNPVPIFIPCHRVVLSNGQTGEYGLGGEANKRTMLRAEGITLEVLEKLARKGIRYMGSDTTRIFCFPTCRHARRVSSAHLVQFHSEAEALSAGYRPCKVCRPAKGA
ncbi:MAG: methylated-DNA--[protein]-cysteine S-methyltransferase [Ktedonobacterales bacterium]